MTRTMTATLTKKSLDAKGFAIRGELLKRLVGKLGTEKVVDAMSDPDVRSFVNFLCQLSADNG